MLELGIFEGQRCELIDGELIDKTGQNPPHAQAIRNLFSCLVSIFGAAQLQMQLPIEVTPPESKWNLPEPDVAVLAEHATGDYGKRYPRGDELLLVIEVADTSLRQDLITKRDLYARAAVGEYWVLDLQLRRLVVHRHAIQGAFSEISVLTGGDLASFADHPTRPSRFGSPGLIVCERKRD